MKKLLTACLLFSFSLLTHGQTDIDVIAQTGSSVQVTLDIDVAESGSVYLSGTTFSAASFGNSVTATGLGYDMFVVKYDANGDAVWAQRGGSTSSLDKGCSVELSPYGELYVGGMFSGSATFGSLSLTGQGFTRDAYIAKYDTLGNIIWVEKQSTMGNAAILDIAVDNSGNAYTLTHFSDTITIDTFTINAISNFAYSYAVAKYDTAGGVEWVRHISTTNSYASPSISTLYRGHGGIELDSAGEVYITGNFATSTQVDTLAVSTTGSWDMFLTKLDGDNGDVIWLKRGGGTSLDMGTDIAISDNQKIYVSGKGNTSMLFGGLSLSPFSPCDFVVEYNTAGNAQDGFFATATNSVFTSNPTIEVDSINQVYLTSTYTGTVTVEGVSRTSTGGDDFYALRYDFIDDELDLLYTIESSASGFSNIQRSYGVHDAGEDDFYVVGYTNATTDFGNNTLVASNYDGFLLRIADCDGLVANAESLQGDSICSGETTTLQADTNSLYDYQWLFNGSAVGGQINETYNVNAAGNYSVVIDSAGCLDTSNVVSIVVNSLPTVSHSNLPNVCDGDDPFTLTGGSPSGGVYSGTGVTGGTTFDPSAAAVGNNILTYTYTDANGCADSVDKTITVQQSPAIFTTTISACEGDPVISLAASAYGFPTGGTHTGTGVVGTTFSPQVAGAGTHIINYESSNGCVSPDSIVATVTATPNVSLGSFSDMCITNTIPLALTGGTPSGGTYSGGPYVISGFFYTLFSGVGTHNIIYTKTESGCSASDTSTITVDPAATASISTLPELCDGDDTLSLVSYGTPLGGTFSGSGVSSNIFNPGTTGPGSFLMTYSYTNACGTATDTQSINVNDPPTISISQTNVSCNGGNDGSATATGSGTSSPYSYAWSNSVSTAANTGLTANTYTVTVTDNNTCSDTAEVTISEPSALSVSAIGNTVSCNGGNNGIASAFASGGTPAYTYNWVSGGTSSIETGLTAGSYTITVTDANLCTETAVAIVTEPLAVTASISGSNVGCSGGSNGSATASATGGTGTKTFAWSTNAGSATTATVTGLTADTYTVTATDANGCTDTETVTITEPAAVVASIGTPTNVSCFGGNDGAATASATGGTGTKTFAWSTNAGSATTATVTGLSADTYTVTATDANGCTDTETVTITEPATAVSASIGTPTNVSCNGGNDGAATASATGGTGTKTFAWSSNAGSATTAAVTGLSADTYTVTATDANGCTDTETVTITEPTAVVASIAGTNASCNGTATGSATASATGGTGTKTFAWSSNAGSATTATVTGLTADTYTVTATDANGCTDTETVTITEPTAVVASIAGTNASCNGTATGSATASATGGTGTKTFAWSTNAGSATTATVTGLTADTYTVTATDANGCTDTETVTITEPTAVVASIGTPTNVSCFGGNDGAATASATGGTGTKTFAWSTNAGSATTATVTGLSADTYTVTATDANGCTDTETVTITEPATAVSASIGTPTNVSCNGGNDGAATASATGGTGTKTFAWSTNAGSATTAAVTGLSADTYTVTATDANGCTDTETVTITEPTAVVASIAGTNASCNGTATGSATASATGGTGTKTFAWSTNAGSATTATVTGLTADTYTVTATDANGCTDTETVTITEPTAVVASIAGTNASCNGTATGSATASATGGTGTKTFAWSTNAGSATTATVTGLTADTYTVTATDANGCTDTETVTITEPTAVVASIGTPTNVSCFGGNDGAATASATGGTGTKTFAWSTNAGSATTATVTGLSADTYTVTATDANGCTDTETVTITEPATAVSASIGTPTNVSCNGGNDGAATASATGGTGTKTFAWSTNAGSATTAAVTGLSADTYTVTATDANGCTDTETVTITEPTAVVASIAGTNASCNGTATGSATASATGGTGTKTFAWSTNAGSATTATVTGLTADTYTVTATDANGCTDTETVTITEPTAVVASIAGTNASCNGTATGSATASATGGTGTKTFAWSTNAGSATTATVTGLTADTYTVTATDANGCTDTETVTITEPTAVVASIGTPTNVSCFGGNDGAATASATGGTGTKTFAWSTNAGSATTATVTGLSADTYTVTATDANGCTDTETVTITEPATAVSASIGTPTNVSCNGGNDGAATASATGGTGTKTFAWSSNAGSATTAAVTGLSADTYTVTATDANGCTDTETVTITEPTAVVASIAGTNASCNGTATGSATASATGGTGTKTFAWSTNAGSATTATVTGLTADTYTVTATDANGCTDTETVTITEPTAVVASIAGTNASCNGTATGSATASATGGTGTKTFAWSTNAGSATTATVTGLTADTYTVTATDANGCTDTETVTITEPTAVVASIGTPTNVSCFGGNDGAATTSATGGTGTKTFAWSTNAGSATTATVTGLSADTYTVTATDANGCTDTETVTITEPATAVSASIGTPTNVSCNGGNDGAATASATGGTGTKTFAWSTNAGSATTAAVTGLSADTYTVTATDANGCTDTETVTITEPTAVVASIAGTNASCNGTATGSATASATGGTGTKTFAWSTNAGSATTATVTGLTADTYTVTATDANGCTDTETVTITEPTAVVASIAGTNASCNGTATGSATASATGGTGTKTFAWSTNAGSATTATVTALTADTYTVTATDANGCTDTETVTITEPTAVVASIGTPTNVSCFGGNDGAATASATGGTGTKTFAWSTNAGSATTATVTGLSADTYTVTATDANGCTDSETMTITEPTQLVATATTTSTTSCSSSSTGTGTAVGIGGTPTYSFAWSSGGNTANVTGLSAGIHTVTITDANNCVATDTLFIDVTDTVNPTAITNNVILNLDSHGVGTIDTSDVNSGSFDNCAIDTMYLDQTTFNCSNVGSNTVVLTVIDINGNMDTAHATVQVNDTIAPVVIVSNDSFYLDATGNVSITASAINNGSYDSCGIASIILSQTNFDCSNVGIVQDTLTVTDVNGNSSFAIANLTILDTVRPTAIAQNQSVYLDANGFASIDALSIDNGSFDNCSIDSIWVSDTLFSCSDTGDNAITFYVRDVSLSIDSVFATVTVIDSVAPSISVFDTVKVYLGINGNGTLIADSVDSATIDNCSIDSIYLSQNDFNCSHVGFNNAMFYAKDVNNNTDSNQFVIQVIDSVGPTVFTNDLIVYLDNTGNVTITASMVDSNSWDSCGIANYVLSQSTFDCGDLGTNSISLAVTDVNGNTNNNTATITVLDTLTAVTITVDSSILCIGDLGGLTAAGSGMTGTYTYAWSNTATTSSITGLGPNNYIVTATAANGCSAIDSAELIEPSAITGNLSAQDISCNGSGDGYVAASAGGGSGPLTYLWNTGSVADSIGGLSGDTFTVQVSDTNGCMLELDTVLFEPDSLIVGMSFNEPSLCAMDSSGIASLQISGGTIPYAIVWLGYTSINDSLEGLAAGTYTAIVTDANLCVASDTQTIMEDSLPLVSFNFPVDSSCQSDVFELTGASPAGGLFAGAGVLGDSIYTDTLNNWSDINYTFIDGNGCSGSALDSIYVTPNPNIEFSMNEIALCAGGTAPLNFATPLGGTYIGDPGIIDTTNQLLVAPDSAYQALITYGFANICGVDTDTFSLVVTENPSVDLGEDIALCNNTIVTIDAGSHETYSWYDGSSNQSITLNNGEEPISEDLIVWVEVSDTLGCIGSDSVNVNVDAQETFYLGNNIEACLKETVSLTVDDVYDNFTWSTGASGLSIIAHDGSLIQPGNYPFYVTGTNNAGGCTYTDTIYVQLLDCDSSFVGISDQPELAVSFELYPNPTRHMLNIKGVGGDVNIDNVTITGIRGELAATYNTSQWNKTSSESIQIDLRSLPNGIYLVQIKHELGINTSRIVVSK